MVWWFLLKIIRNSWRAPLILICTVIWHHRWFTFSRLHSLIILSQHDFLLIMFLIIRTSKLPQFQKRSFTSQSRLSSGPARNFILLVKLIVQILIFRNSTKPFQLSNCINLIILTINSIKLFNRMNLQGCLFNKSTSLLDQLSATRTDNFRLSQRIVSLLWQSWSRFDSSKSFTFSFSSLLIGWFSCLIITIN